MSWRCGRRGEGGGRLRRRGTCGGQQQQHHRERQQFLARPARGAVQAGVLRVGRGDETPVGFRREDIAALPSRQCARRGTGTSDGRQGAALAPSGVGRRASGEDASWVSEAVGAEAAPAGLPRPFRGGRNEKRDGRWAIPCSITAGGEVRLSSSDRGFPAAVRRWRPCRGNRGTGWSGRRCCRARGSWRGRCRRSCATGRRSP